MNLLKQVILFYIDHNKFSKLLKTTMDLIFIQSYQSSYLELIVLDKKSKIRALMVDVKNSIINELISNILF